MGKSLYSTDESVVEGIRNGEDAALKVLYKTHYSMVLHFILNNNGSEQDARDIYQEAVIVLYEKINEGSFELNSKLKTFIYSVCRRLWLKRLNELNRFGNKINDSDEYIDLKEDMTDLEENEEKFRLMGQALSELGEPCKTLIEDFYIRSLSMTDITEKFGYTNTDNAKNQKYKCLMRLKKLFFSNYSKKEAFNVFRN